MIGNTLSAEVKIRFVPMQSGQPKRLLATAEFILYFAGALPDMKITGLSLWEGESDAAVTLTLPAGPGSAGDYYCFRPVSGEIRDLVEFKRQIVDAYRVSSAHRGS